ncbi:hypothetical protein ACFL12_03120 [Pseudomonadota bacterium]
MSKPDGHQLFGRTMFRETSPCILFQRLTRLNLWIARIFVVLGWQVRYAGFDEGLGAFLAQPDCRVYPIDFQNCAHIDVSPLYSDSKGDLTKAVDHIVSSADLECFSTLFTGVSDAAAKLKLCVRVSLLARFQTLQLMETWLDGVDPEAKAKIILILQPGALAGLLKPEFVARHTVVTLPSIRPVLDLASRMFRAVVGRVFRGEEIDESIQLVEVDEDASVVNRDRAEVLFFPHKGLDFGKLFQKNHFYSDDPDSQFHRSNILHVELESHNVSENAGVAYASLSSPSLLLKLRALKGVAKVMLPNGGLILAGGKKRYIFLMEAFRCYSQFFHYRRELEQFPGAKMALVGYEYLFPVPLALACEAQGIRTVAAQERFHFSHCEVAFVLSNYLCASQFSAEKYQQSGLGIVDRWTPVGMARTDLLHEYRYQPIPECLKQQVQGRKLVVALDYHSQPDRIDNCLQPVVNWQANRQFLEDLLTLANAIPEAYFVIRGKNADWVRLPAFADLVLRIDAAENISVDRTYDTFNFSYRLCANADLVIAKHTSLGAECMAVGIPVLFHDYAPNADHVFARTFDYLGSSCMTHDFETLQSRAITILRGGGNPLLHEEAAIMLEMFGEYNDGEVKDHIQSALSEMSST